MTVIRNSLLRRIGRLPAWLLGMTGKGVVGFLRWIRFLPRNPALPFWKYYLRHLPALLVFFVLTQILESAGYFRGTETYSLDLWLRFNDTPRTGNIVLVLIDDQDYAGRFSGRSPLDAGELKSILDDIQRAGPRLVAVDIDTSHSQFASTTWPSAVWARTGSAPSSPPGDELETTPGDAANVVIRRGDLLGKYPEEVVDARQHLISTRPKSGLASFLADPDGVVRFFHPRLQTVPVGESGAGPWWAETLPSAIVSEFRRLEGTPAGQESAPPESGTSAGRLFAGPENEGVLMNFAFDRGRFRRMTARSLTASAREEFWEDNSPLRDAIVLVGGTYASARDLYMTPVGPMYGIELIACAVETGLAGNGVRPIGQRWAQLLDLAVGSLMIFISWRFPGRHSFMIGLASVFLLAIGASFVVFRVFAFWFSFVPLLGGQWIEMQWERGRELSRLEAENRKLKLQLASSGNAEKLRS